MRKLLIVNLLPILLVLSGASAHEHKPPHKGTLVEFKEEFAHLELVLDPASGKVSGYVLDGEAENAVRVKQKTIEIKVLKTEKTAELTLVLKQQVNALSGETEGDSSEFAGQSEQLKGMKEFDAQVNALTVKGKEYKDVKFNFPKGNE